MSLVGELAMRQMQSVLADLRAAEARAEAERERAERLRMALLVAEEPLHDHGATWLSCHPARLAIAKALADADRRRAGQGEPADDFDWTAWAHGHIAVVEQENIRLAARVRELEEAQGELLGLLFPAKSCAMCGRRVSDEGEGLNRDCGGDCWGCMVESCPDDPDVIAWHRKRLEGRR